METLIQRARELGIDTTDFEALVKHGESIARTALQKVIKEKEKERAAVNHRQIFTEQHAADLQALMLSLVMLRERVQTYNAEHGAALALNLNADKIDELLSEKQRRQPTSSDRDLVAMIQRMQELGHTLHIRVRLGEVEHTGTLSEAGRVRSATGEEYSSPNAWLHAIRGNKAGGNAWRSVQVQIGGEWLSLERAYERLMNDADDADADDTDADDGAADDTDDDSAEVVIESRRSKKRS